MPEFDPCEKLNEVMAPRAIEIINEVHPNFNPYAFGMQAVPASSEPLIGNDDFSRYAINEWAKEDVVAHSMRLDKDCARFMPKNSTEKALDQDTAMEAEETEYE